MDSLAIKKGRENSSIESFDYEKEREEAMNAKYSNID